MYKKYIENAKWNNYYVCNLILLAIFMRLDVYLLKNNFTDSRNQAQELIRSWRIKVDWKICTKSSFDVKNHKVNLLSEKVYVSRAAQKLKDFLLSENINVNNKLALDIWSSRWGFIQVLLEFDVEKIVAVDVWEDQLHPCLRNNSKVEVREKTDIRKFIYFKKFDIITSDVSFISLSKIITSIDRLILTEWDIIFII